jgi:hypothetical protein
MQIGNWSTDAAGLDLLRQIPGSHARELGYDDLAECAVQIQDEGRTFLVASLADIAASRRAAGRPKDLEALPELDRLLENDS